MNDVVTGDNLMLGYAFFLFLLGYCGYSSYLAYERSSYFLDDFW